jgi:hypothetical protein
MKDELNAEGRDRGEDMGSCERGSEGIDSIAKMKSCRIRFMLSWRRKPCKNTITCGY